MATISPTINPANAGAATGAPALDRVWQQFYERDIASHGTESLVGALCDVWSSANNKSYQVLQFLSSNKEAGIIVPKFGLDTSGDHVLSSLSGVHHIHNQTTIPGPPGTDQDVFL